LSSNFDFFEEVGYAPNNKRLDFGADPDHYTDPRFFLPSCVIGCLSEVCHRRRSAAYGKPPSLKLGMQYATDNRQPPKLEVRY